MRDTTIELVRAALADPQDAAIEAAVAALYREADEARDRHDGTGLEDLFEVARLVRSVEVARGTPCPGCVRCGPPILVTADEGCDGSGTRGRASDPPKAG